MIESGREEASLEAIVKISLPLQNDCREPIGDSRSLGGNWLSSSFLKPASLTEFSGRQERDPHLEDLVYKDR